MSDSDANASDPTAQAHTLMQQVAGLRSNIKTLYGHLGFEQGNCRACGRLIWWGVTKAGKRAPYTADALNHFADCPGADQFRKKKA
jgi:hypothetical protein